MRTTKLVTTIAAVGIVGLAAMAPSKAEARCIGCWVGAGVAAGVIGGALLSGAAWGYPGYGYGYPAYGYAYSPAYYGYGYAPSYSYGYAGYPAYGYRYGYRYPSYGYRYAGRPNYARAYGPGRAHTQHVNYRAGHMGNMGKQHPHR